jgi:hypothetical protein
MDEATKNIPSALHRLDPQVLMGYVTGKGDKA